MIYITQLIYLKEGAADTFFEFENLLTLKIKELFLLLNKVNSAGLREIMASLFTPNMYSFREIIESHLYSG